MPAYITLLNFTDQGLKAVKDTAKRARAFQAHARKAGVKVREVYWTMGRYDAVLVAEARNEETIRAFSANEIARITRGMP